MSNPDESKPEPQDTWLQGRDILPSNIPTAQSPALTPEQPSNGQAPRRKPRRWSLIVGLPVVAIVFLVVGFFVGTNLTGGSGAGSAAGMRTLSNVGGDPLVSAQVDPTPPIPKAPVLFLEAQAKADGQAMWDQLAPEAQQAITQGGGSPEALTAALQKNPLPTLRQITFVAGYQMNDGREATIYVVTADVNGSRQQVPFFFTVDTNGKIDEYH